MTWVVDAMNVIGTRADRWWNDPDAAMVRLVEELDDHARSTGRDLTLVFDRKPAGLDYAGPLRVVVARRRGRNAADHEIETIVSESDDPTHITVVTSDRKLADSVRSMGAKVKSSGNFLRLLENPSRSDVR